MKLSVFVCVFYLYADVEIHFPYWINWGFLEEYSHNLYSVPEADGTIKNQEDGEEMGASYSIYNKHYNSKTKWWSRKVIHRPNLIFSGKFVNQSFPP